MNEAVRGAVTVVALSSVGVLSHFLPHPMGLSSVGAIGMLAMAYAPRSVALLPVLATTLFVDALAGQFYGALAMAIVYAAHMIAAIGIAPILRRVGVLRVAGASSVSAVLFYLASNLQPLVAGYYPPTLDGVLACYVAGLPYLARGIFANLLYGGVAFTIIELGLRQRAHRYATA